MNIGEDPDAGSVSARRKITYALFCRANGCHTAAGDPSSFIFSLGNYPPGLFVILVSTGETWLKKKLVIAK
ncbi:hypothetical protein CRP01_20530 [Flavilitoribacter nigricans DSM 23189 = NBRC 102662]|uniref:Uncharacterized protein n=1 Tax=Flavilitoribacter nigricans (strain ATCC 23147 / DSM 23189 / NBRC 102662 / NCIMB 1420 / SS-2) TaxID=1122177 RepID=A0A2D0N8C2_FLAN2|nr:hypothetical protein CRP01_20530 [Flavilitoribacter nigricans DSM 23189 = NBRC 102662]